MKIAMLTVPMALVLLAGCGSSSSPTTTTSTISAVQLRAAKRAGEEKARERDRVDNLQKQLHSLKRQVRHRHSAAASGSGTADASAAAPAPTPESDAPLRSFHAPSGNVSCEIAAAAATCTVGSVGETFTVEAGLPGRAESAAVLPSDLGEAVGYGETVTAGSFSCEVPPSDVPRGVTCVDSATGHGFEASRIGDRQKTY